VVKLLSSSVQGKGITLNVEVNPGVPRVIVGDAVRLRQVLVNLVGNAVKFTSSGGVRLRISASGHAPDERGRTGVTFTVTDTGVGIPPEKLGSIFDDFAQAHDSFGGTGLGLAIASQLVDMMGGQIEVRSTLGKGSTFFFTVWLEARRDDADVAEAVQLTLAPVHGRSLHVLVADDNMINRTLVKRVLEKAGHYVSLASDGREAVEASEGRRFDLVFMDIKMPVMDGLEAARAIREREALCGEHRTPIVALTANAFAEDREQCFEAGMDECLVKPIKVAELQSCLERVLARP
jgi:CheY-like chemotaxis protein/anti-sigma regulatory factor (Ser/Thr protein kinase)